MRSQNLPDNANPLLEGVMYGTNWSSFFVYESRTRYVCGAVRSQEEWMHAVSLQDPEGIAIVEAALLIEAGAADRFDCLIVVTCEMEQRIERFAKRQKVDLETARAEVTRRMAAQLPDGEKVKAADYVLDNSGSLELTRKQVQHIWDKLQTVTSHQ